ncbi:CHAT domain-containing protein [Kitasatospora sp. NPDC058965]|uniref:CHAT domain-containing protein n=1 Tax=Kitasatospora sp. NPDC058965 TaxID=3346682 RepID=UPI0036835547
MTADAATGPQQADPDLDRRYAAALTAAGWPPRAVRAVLLLNADGLDTRARAEVEQAVAVLEEFLAGYAATLDATEVDHLDHHLAQGHRVLFDRTDDLAHLDRAVAHLERRVRYAPWLDPLVDLAFLLACRYDRAHHAPDLDRAVELARQAVAHPDRDPDETLAEIALAQALGLRAHRPGPQATADRAEALLLLNSAYARAEGRPELRAIAGQHLVVNLTYVLAQGGFADTDLLGRAVRISSELVAGLEPRTPGHAGALGGMAMLTLARDLHGDPDAVRAARDLAEQAVAQAPPGSWAELQVLLSSTVVGEYLIGLQAAEPADVAAAQRVLDRLVALAPTPAHRAFAHTARAQHRWLLADFAGGIADWEQRLAALATLAGPQLSVGMQAQGLHTHEVLDGLPATVLLAAAEQAGTPPELARQYRREALRLLDRGRGLLLGRALALEADLARLRDQDEELADGFERVSAELDRRTAPEAALRADPRALRELAGRREALAARIRARPGFATFLAPPAFADLVPAAAHGPVVLVGAFVLRGDALILRPDGEVDAVPLPGLTPEAVDAAADALADQLDGDGDLGPVLAWCWDTVMAPVMARLALDGPVPRLRLVPTGRLALLPLHAAEPEGARGMRDTVVSYAPTVRHLARAAARPPVAWDRRRTVGLAVSHRPPDAPLPAAGREVAVAAARPLVGAEATAQNLLRALELTPDGHLHLCCHAEYDRHGVENTRLRLADGDLTVGALNRLPGQRGYAAFLSGCETAATGAWLGSEPLSLSAVFHALGFAHVVGALWSIPDPAAEWFARAYYDRLAACGGDVARALHLAVGDARARYEEPAVWAAFTHTGP